ncbi:hypothetical protein RDWZM_006731 [Blomia tropicalis]|uniref:Uncharacterized protein n=1 Tax=Blomia tropicalis TaxID=40697 RepID=A0A9Q0M8N9_BLOTA|nr:hypothetical protein RDWZM_006731 [Blomia tropicalis]
MNFSESTISFLLLLLAVVCISLAKHIRRPSNNDLGGFNHNDQMKIVCYYGSWAVYRPGNGKFPVEEIDPFLCSHIIYGFTGLSAEGKIRPLDPYNDLKDNWGKGAFQRFNALKQTNKNLKTLVAIGGWNEGSLKYSNMAKTEESRAIFVNSVVEFLDMYGFDGLDFDWEYPGARGGSSNDKRNFVTLLKELKEAFRSKDYLLTAAVSAGKYFADIAYDIPQVSKYLDFINVMAYDFHGGWEKKTGHNAPLYARPDEYGNERILNNYSINYWINNGAPRNKIILGMGTYGQAGPYTREGGSLGYNEICEKVTKRREEISQVWDPYHMAPYAYWGRQWVGFDNIESIKIKAQYAKAMRLGGGMVWSIETDDFRGDCGNGRYPLINAIKSVFQDDNIPELPVPKPGGSSPEKPTSKPPRPDSTTTSTTKRPPTTSTTTRPTTTSTTSRPITTSSTRRPTITSTTTSTTTRRPITSTTTITSFPTQSPTTVSTTTKFTTCPTSTTTQRPTTEKVSSTTESSSSSTSSTINWWPHKSSTWWPQKPQSSWSPSSEIWTSSTVPSVHSKNPNSIHEEAKSETESESLPKEFKCYESGLFRNPDSCLKFIRCVETKIEGQFQLFYHECPDKTVFNNQTQLCDWVENVPECIRSVPKHYFRGSFQTNFELVHGSSIHDP